MINGIGIFNRGGGPGGIYGPYNSRVIADGGVSEASECVNNAAEEALNSSLVLVPSGYKAGKVYSEVPTNGDGDLSFTRSNDTATRVNSAGLIEKVRTNLALQSQTFDNASWVKTNTTVTANAQTAPDGTLTADTMTIADGNSRIVQVTSLGAGTYTISAYVKVLSTTTAGTVRFAPVVDGSNLNSFFTPTTEWARYTQTFTATTGVTSIALRGAAGGFVGDVAIWGAQLELSDFGATDYIPTTSAAVSVGMLANVPRLDYSGGGCPKLLLEPQRTNLVEYSEQMDNAAWTKTNCTITANDAVSPDGYTNADKLVESSDVSAQTHQIRSSTTNIVTNQVYTYSIFAKGSGRGIQMRASRSDGSTFSTVNVDYDLTLGVVDSFFESNAEYVSSSIEDYGNGWYRCILQMKFTDPTNISQRMQVYTYNESTNSVNYIGDGTSGAYIWGAQIEVGSYASSYIPTLGAAVTRGADACFKTGISSLIGQTEGTIFVEIDTQNISESVRIIELGTGSSTNRIVMRLAASSVSVIVTLSGVAQATFSSSTLTNGNYKIALGYADNDFVLYINGTLQNSSSSGSVPTCPNLYVGYSPYTGSPLGGRVAQSILFPTRLTNTQLAELTTL